jgi:hypothetical protein
MKILVKECGRAGSDAKMFRAYKDDGQEPSNKTTLKVSASCTGNEAHGALNCAAKAFAKYAEPHGDPDEIKTRVRVRPDENVERLWIAELSPKSPCDYTHPMANCSWISTEIGKPDSDTTVLVCSPGADEPVWLGYWDSENDCWREVDGLRYETKVTHWMQLPNPPEVQS